MKAEINIFYVADNSALDDFGSKIWLAADSVLLKKYWSGVAALPERRAQARLLWSDNALFVRFDCAQHEPFVISQNPQTNCEAAKLWERDVCEIFIAPDANQPEKYFEFEVAPTGEWLDYAILQLPDRREIDIDYNANLKIAAQILKKSFSLIFSIEWAALGKKPETGDRWLGNLFRCIGAGATRGYLAWQPTLTIKPNFHVPQVFGSFKFEKKTSNQRFNH